VSFLGTGVALFFRTGVWRLGRSVVSVTENEHLLVIYREN
jgi:hypothetical protein